MCSCVLFLFPFLINAKQNNVLAQRKHQASGNKKKKERGNVTAAGADGTITHFILSAVAAASVRGGRRLLGQFQDECSTVTPLRSTVAAPLSFSQRTHERRRRRRVNNLLLNSAEDSRDASGNRWRRLAASDAIEFEFKGAPTHERVQSGRLTSPAGPGRPPGGRSSN